MFKVALTAPSGNVLDQKPIEKTKQLFEQRGWKVTLGKTLTTSKTRFAGVSDKARADEFNELCAKNDLVLCARGGYGMSRIIDRIDYELIAEKGTWVAGFSDITAFSLAYLSKKDGMSLQAPTASVLGAAKTKDVTINAFFQAIACLNYTLSFPTRAQNMTIQGTLWGGNLSVLCALLGTPYFPKIKNGILFLEDVAEPAYKIERYLMQLIQAGVIRSQKAVIFGQFSSIKESAHDFGYTLTDAVNYVRTRTKTPFVTGLPFGHSDTLCTLVVGSDATLDICDGQANLTLMSAPGLDTGENF